MIHFFEYPLQPLESLKCFNPVLSFVLIENWYFASYGSLAYKYILSVCGCWFIRLNNEFVFPDPEPLIINILYGWSWISGQSRLFSVVFFFYNIKVNHFLYHFIILLHLISSLSLTKSLLFPYTYVSIESIDWLVLSSFELE